MFITHEIVIIIVVFGFAALVTYVLKDVVQSEKSGYSYLLIVIAVFIYVIIGFVVFELLLN
ncbi:hypothetical protein [Alkalibacillus salilacus]|uniref:Uncharacterized protein n=1 Tax=Alkalibacillus salilacus TaxID=284582 RepID=A0ABT9VB58_9BACI|nr:hypothetical protein [Alkalibacillus salilacus]MDQ0158200.1 hypothetical protein [Alkalibacillus salilacus]